VTRRPVLVPLFFSVVLFGIYWFVKSEPRLLNAFDVDRATVLNALLLLAWIALIFFAVRAFDLVAFDVFASKRRNVQAPVLLREIVSVGLFAVLMAWAISEIYGGSKITAFLATGTVVAAVLGLALQETLGNLFSGIALGLEGAFEVGDVIRTGDLLGVVESLRWRGTHIRTFNNNIAVIPNSVLAREKLEVFPRRNLNARILPVGVDYNFPPATVINILTQAASNVHGVSHELPCFARVAGFAESAVTYEIKYFTHDYSQRDRIDAEIRKAVWYALRRNSVSIPYPIRMHQRYEAPDHRQHPDASRIIERLAKVDILSPLAQTALETIAEAARMQTFSRGETIIRQGTVGDSMFIVHSGEVSVRAGGEEVAKLGEGEFFGEMALLTGEVRAADVIAMTDVVTVEITKAALEPVLRDHPELAAAISEKVVERRGSLDSLKGEGVEEEKGSVLSRIRAYFGL